MYIKYTYLNKMCPTKYRADSVGSTAPNVTDRCRAFAVLFALVLPSYRQFSSLWTHEIMCCFSIIQYVAVFVNVWSYVLKLYTLSAPNFNINAII